ncbi:MAG: hypothetical protein ACLGXA_18260, partial [Acidobacteriota bacterium]
MAATDHNSIPSSISLRFQRREVLKMVASLPAAVVLSRASLAGGALGSLANTVTSSDGTLWKPRV